MAKSLIFRLLILCSVLLSVESCQEKGCTDDAATNYNTSATFEDGSCRYTFGCTDSNSFNYDATAGIDDGSCRNFINWSDWVLISTKEGVDTTAAIEHKGFDTLAVRKVYVLNDQLPVDSLYPEGTMIASHAYSMGDTLEVIAAMMKREAGFSATSNDWEWFILNRDGSVAKDNNGDPLRGANLLEGYCTACHAKAGIDYVFSN